MVLSLDELIKRYPNRDVRSSFKQYLDEEIPSCEGIVRENLLSYQNHLELIRAIASCFLPETQLSLDTGYEFRFTEPLFEKGVKNFDILITDGRNGRALFVEGKTFSGSISDRVVKEKFNENRERIKVVEKEIETLSEKVSHHIDYGSIEVAMIVDMVHVDDLMRKYEKVEMEERYKPIILYYDEMKGTLNLVEGFHLHNQQLERELMNGIPVHEIGGMINIPCLISDHPFQILRNVIINDPGTSRSQDNIMIKDFTRGDIQSGLEKIPLQCSRVLKRRTINDTTRIVLDHCLKYQIITKKDKEGNRFRLLCKGNRRSVVDNELFEKYVKNWSRKRADEKARERLEREYRKDTSLYSF